MSLRIEYDGRYNIMPREFWEALPKWTSKLWLTFEVAIRYCGVPPVLPSRPEPPNTDADEPTPRHEELCIVCGRVHVTSEHCGRQSPVLKSQSEIEEGQYRSFAHRLSIGNAMRSMD
jgi:hypothetical protein